MFNIIMSPFVCYIIVGKKYEIYVAKYCIIASLVQLVDLFDNINFESKVMRMDRDNQVVHVGLSTLNWL